MPDMTNTSRHQKGAPASAGGQFKAQNRDESPVTLVNELGLSDGIARLYFFKDAAGDYRALGLKSACKVLGVSGRDEVEQVAEVFAATGDDGMFASDEPLLKEPGDEVQEVDLTSFGEMFRVATVWKRHADGDEGDRPIMASSHYNVGYGWPESAVEALTAHLQTRFPDDIDGGTVQIDKDGILTVSVTAELAAEELSPRLISDTMEATAEIYDAGNYLDRLRNETGLLVSDEEAYAARNLHGSAVLAATRAGFKLNNASAVALASHLHRTKNGPTNGFMAKDVIQNLANGFIDDVAVSARGLSTSVERKFSYPDSWGLGAKVLADWMRTLPAFERTQKPYSSATPF